MKSETTAFNPVFPDIFSLLHYQARCRAEKTCITTDHGDSIDYAGLLNRTLSIADTLFNACSSSPGRRPRIGIVLPNGPDTAIALLGAACGGTALPFNPGYRYSEFTSYFNETHLDALLVSDNEDGPCVEAAFDLGLKVVRLSESTRMHGNLGDAVSFPVPGPGDIALVLLTSGSTGRAKCVPLTHRNLCTSARDVCKSINLSEADTCLAMWEQYHIGGLVDLLLAPLSSGGRVICTTGFDAAEFYRLLDRFRPTWSQFVPTSLSELLFHAARHEIQPRSSTLRLLRSVAAALPHSIKVKAELLFGVPVIQTFGMTEAGPLISSTRLPPAINKPASVGFSCGPEIAIFDSMGIQLGPNEGGEVAIRGDNVFLGYENDSDENRLSFRNGWFFTGDMGLLDDDGELFLTGRVKQLINRGGEKVNPQEIDNVLLTHPAVKEAAAFPLKHRTLGEDVGVAVVLASPVEIGEIRDFLSARLATFKVPQRIKVVTDLPRTSIGKIDRLALAAACEIETQDQRSISPPTTDTEVFLSRLWANELDLEQVGIHDGFASLGGDSLSGLRLHLAVEKAIGVPIPDGFCDPSSTVAQMAKRMSAILATVDGSRLGGAAFSFRQLADLNVKQVFQSISVGLAGEQDNLDDAYQRFRSCGSLREMRILGDSITVYATPAELRRMLARTDELSLVEPSSRLSDLPASLLLKLARWEWRRSLEQSLVHQVGCGDWHRSSLAPSAFLYRNLAIPSESKALVIAFGGNALRLMMPTYGILCNLDSRCYDLLLLVDPQRSHFSDGVDGLGRDLNALSLYLRDYAGEHKYCRVIYLGTSSGGIPALYVGLKNQCSSVVAVGADHPDSSRHGLTSNALKEIIDPRRPVQAAISLCYGSGNKRDRAAAVALSDVFQEAKLVAVEGYKTHNLLWELYQAGELDLFLARHLSA